MKASVFTSLFSTFLWIFTVGHCLVEWQHCALSPLPELPGHHHTDHNEQPQPGNCEIQSTRPAASIVQSEQDQNEIVRLTTAVAQQSAVLLSAEQSVWARQSADETVTSIRLLRSSVAPNAPPLA